jgi:cytochrome c oxidase subunit IV
MATLQIHRKSLAYPRACETDDPQHSTAMLWPLVFDLFSVHFCITVLDIPGLLNRTAFRVVLYAGKGLFLNVVMAMSIYSASCVIWS